MIGVRFGTHLNFRPSWQDSVAEARSIMRTNAKGESGVLGGGDGVSMGVTSGRSIQKKPRWKKKNQTQVREERTTGQPASGDAIADADATLVGSVNKVMKSSIAIQKKEANVRKTQRRQGRVVAMKKKKKRKQELHDQEQAENDRKVRTSPHEFLWESYVKWAGDKLSPVEKASEKWTSDQVMSAEVSNDSSLVPVVKQLISPDYLTMTGWEPQKNKPPAIPLLSLCNGGVQAVSFGRRVYDGAPVGKLFSKHIKLSMQTKWLSICSSRGKPANASGTAKRVQRLLELGAMTLEHTVAIMIDMSRDTRLFNLLDVSSTRDELFELIHMHVRSKMASGQLKLILVIPNEDEMPTERRGGNMVGGKNEDVSEDRGEDNGDVGEE